MRPSTIALLVITSPLWIVAASVTIVWAALFGRPQHPS